MNRTIILGPVLWLAVVAFIGVGCSQQQTKQEQGMAMEEPAPEPVAEPAPPPEPAVMAADSVAQPEPVPEPEAPMLKPSRPETYVVVSGDTLWDIATAFLEDPWVWPQIWDVNPQIANPHLIYPGDIISLTFVDGQPRLVVERPGTITEDGVTAPTSQPFISGADASASGTKVVRLSPSIRVEPLNDSIPAISANAISQFTVKPRVLTQEELGSAPYIIGNFEERLISASGNQIYARGLDDAGESLFSIFRSGREHKDPITGESLGFEAIYIGDSKVLHFGDPSTLVITENKREALNGDVLLPLDRGRVAHNYIPRKPDISFEGRVISLFDAISQSAQNQTIAINIGQRDGIEIGDILAIFSEGQQFTDRYQGRRDKIKLPDERNGIIMVVRSFDRVSYGLVMESVRPIHYNDLVTTPR